MGISINTGGQLKDLISLNTNVSGQLKELISLSTNVGGQLKEIYTSLPEGLNLYWGGFTGASCRVEITGQNSFDKTISTYPIGKFKINNTAYVSFDCNEHDAVTKKYANNTLNIKNYASENNYVTISQIYFHSYYVVELKTENSVKATPYATWNVSKQTIYGYASNGNVGIGETQFGSTNSLINFGAQLLDKNEYYVFASRACVMTGYRNSHIYRCEPLDFEGMEMNLNVKLQTLP